MPARITPAAPASVYSLGLGLCTDCGEEVAERWTQLGSGEPLRCARHFDDWFFRDSTLETRRKAEAHHDAVIEWFLYGAPN